MLIGKIKAVVLDLDGTIYIGNTIIDGALDVVELLKSQGIKVFYCTNNSTKTRKQIYDKLIGMGFELSIDDIYTSSYAAAIYAKNNELNDVYCVGSEGFKEELINNGIRVVDSGKEVKAVIIGLDLKFNYDKLARVLNIIRNDCRIIACNRDKNFPIEGDILMPGCGPIVSAIENCFHREVDFEVGKPHTFMMELMSSSLNFKKEEILVVGDSYDYDIRMANQFNCPSVLISNQIDKKFSGTITIKDITELKKLISI